VTEKFEYTGYDLDVMSSAKNYNNWILDGFRPYINHKVIEIGAGQGSLSELMLKQCTSLISIEPDEANYNIICNKFKGNNRATVFLGFLNDLPQEVEKADTIFYINVLEHVENEVEELSLAKELLNPEGHICVFVPALQILYGAIDKQVGHYRRYSKKYLIDLFENKLNMKIVKINYFDIVGVIPWYILSCVFKLTGQNQTTVKIYDKLVVPVMSKIEKLLKLPFGKNIYIVATQK